MTTHPGQPMDITIPKVLAQYKNQPPVVLAAIIQAYATGHLAHEIYEILDRAFMQEDGIRDSLRRISYDMNDGSGPVSDALDRIATELDDMTDYVRSDHPLQKCTLDGIAQGLVAIADALNNMRKNQ